MKCEMCGGTDLIKQDGFFVCQNCFTKYSVEEAKKIMVEFDGPVEITGSVKIDKNYETIVKMADDAYANRNYKEAYDYYTQYLEQFPNDYERKFCRALSYGWGTKIAQMNHVDIAVNYLDEYCGCVVADTSLSDKDKSSKIAKSFTETFSLLVAVFNLSRSIYVDDGVTSIRSYNEFLDSVTFIVERQFYLFKLMEKYFYNCLALQDEWTHQVKNIEIELSTYKKKYTGYDTFYLNDIGEKRYREMDSKNQANKNKLISLVTETKKKIQLDRNAKYWEEHKELKESLLSEKDELSDKNETYKKEILTLEEQIASVKNANPVDSSEFDKRVKEANEEISKLESELKSLSFFKLKEKRAVTQKIEDVRRKIDSINKEKLDCKAQFDKEIAKKYQKEAEEIAIKKTVMANNNKRIDEINNKLNANY